MAEKTQQEATPVSKRAVTIKVIGIGGAGGNAVNSMIDSKEFRQDVDFIVANTDIQALDNSVAKEKIQLGKKITRGLGSGSDPETGRRSAEEDLETVKRALEGADLTFLTAGLGGGTGTGALPVITKTAKEQGMLTIAVVTKPFLFEGRRRAVFAQQALEVLHKVADTILVVPNQKLLEVADPKTSMLEAFNMSNNVLKQAVKGISDIIQKTGVVNVDFADVKSIIKDMGLAIMGTGVATGPDRARIAAIEAINSPLLDNISIQGARGILLNITGNADMGLHEINEAAQVVYKQVSEDANIIIGSVIDPSMEDRISVTVVATGLDPELCSHVFQVTENKPREYSFQPVKREIPTSRQDDYDQKSFQKPKINTKDLDR
jgi:cell division protein FtsZ